MDGLGREKESGVSLEFYYGGPPTPVNDRPFVLYALEQITRSGASSRDGSETLRVRSYESTSSLPSAVGSPVYPPQAAHLPKTASWPRRSQPVEEPNHPKLDPNFKFRFHPADSLASLTLPDPGEEIYLAHDNIKSLRKNPKTPPLDFLPWTLRHWTRNLLTAFIMVVIVGLLVCAEYSRRSEGLLDFGRPWDGRYVLFHYLFPILAAEIYLWIQGTMATLWRVVGFMTLTSPLPKKRNEALFFNLYPSAMMLPRLGLFKAGQPLLAVIGILAFAVIFTIPLSSALYTTQLHNGTWLYTTNLPIAYLLVTCYIFALLALFGLWMLHFRRPLGTGLKSDPRSLADIITLLSRSNCLNDYEGTELLSEKHMRELLVDRADKIGYWRTTKLTQGEFYGICHEGAPARRYSIKDAYPIPSSTRRYDSYDAEKGLDIDSPSLSHASKPWYLSRPAVLAWPVVFGSLYTTLLIISFHPHTTILAGFPPGLNAKSDAAGFSRSNFAYSFVPSLLGLLLFLGMQRLFFTLARLYPWAEMSKEGGETAGRSILLDYAASATTPFGATAKAVGNGHWVVAVLSVTTPVSAVIPVVGGGFLSAFEARPSGDLLVFPHQSAFYTLLVILGLYLVTLIVVAISVLTMEKRLRLPKPITSLADITSMLYASGVIGDAVFQGVYNRVDLRTRLLAARERGGSEVRYCFGTFMGKDGERHLGIERVGREVNGEKLGMGTERRSRRERRREMDGELLR